MRLQLGKRPAFSLTVGAIVSFVELGLEVPLDPLRRGIEALLRAERCLERNAKLTVSPMELFAFSIAAAPSMTASWVRTLQRAVRVNDTGQPSAVLLDRLHRVELVMKNRAVTSVRRLKARHGS